VPLKSLAKVPFHWNKSSPVLTSAYHNDTVSYGLLKIETRLITESGEGIRLKANDWDNRKEQIRFEK